MDSIFANRPLSHRAAVLSLSKEESRAVISSGVEKQEPCQFECRRRRCIENQLSNFKLSKLKMKYHLRIEPKKSLFDINLKELWAYRDLIALFVRRGGEAVD